MTRRVAPARVCCCWRWRLLLQGCGTNSAARPSGREPAALGEQARSRQCSGHSSLTHDA